jgi:HK97 family phage portal protein
MNIFQRAASFLRAAAQGFVARGEEYLTYQSWVNWPFSRPRNQFYLSEMTALSISAFWCGVKVISEGVARLPLNKVQRIKGKGAEHQDKETIYWLVKKRPNPMMNSFVWRELGQHHLLTHGNAYSRIERNGLGEVKALWPLHPTQVRPDIEGNKLIYHVSRSDGMHVFDQEDILHIRGLSLDGILGLSPLQLHQRTMGIAAKAEMYGDNFLTNNAQPTFALKHPGRLGKAGRDNLRESWEETHAGPSNAGRVAVLEEGVEPYQLTLPPDSVQFIQTRGLTPPEVSRILNIAPAFLHDLQHSADRSNMEQMMTNLKVLTLDPWCVRWEEQLEMQFITVEQLMEGHAWSFDRRQLERADFAARMEGYSKGRSAGVYSIDDVMEIEDRAPLQNGAGTTYLIPANHVILDPTKPEDEQIINPALAGKPGAEEPDEPAVDERGETPPVPGNVIPMNKSGKEAPREMAS